MLETGLIAYQKNSEKYNSSGYVAQGMQMMIIDRKNRKPLAAEFRGEIWCKCPFMIKEDGISRYLFNKEYLFRKNANKTYNSIDAGRMKQGTLLFTIINTISIRRQEANDVVVKTRIIDGKQK